MVFLIRLQGDELLGHESFLLEFLNLALEDDFGVDCGVNAGGLDGNHENSSVLQEVSAVHGNDSCLVWLSDIGEHEVDHLNHESVLLRLSGVLDNGNYVGSFLCHGNQVSSASGRELHCIKNSFLSNNVGDVRAGGS